MNVYAFFDHNLTPVASAYAAPLLAAIMQPVHDFDTPNGVASVTARTVPLRTDGLRLTIGSLEDPMPVTLPLVGATTRTAFAVLVARSVYQNPDFLWWADGWLTGRDRTRATALAMMSKPLASADRAYVAHWALMSAAFPHEYTLAAQTAALVAAYVSHDVDFASLAEAALAIG